MEVSTLSRPTTTVDPAATAEDILAAADRVRSHYTGTDPNAVTVPDGWELIHIGQAWSVGPTGSGTHLLVELCEIPSAIATFEQQLHRAAQMAGAR